MRDLLLDDGLPRSLATELERRGRTARTVSDLGLQGATDAELLEAVAGSGAVLVTVEPALLDARRPAGATVALVTAREHDARREAVHRHAHAMAAQRAGSARRY